MARGKKRQTSVLSYVTVSVVTLVLICAMGIWIGELKEKNNELIERESQLYDQIEEESSLYDELVEKYEYVKTDDYVMDVARTCFGLIKEGEMLVKQSEDE